MWGRAVERSAWVAGVLLVGFALGSPAGCGARTGLLDLDPVDAAPDVVPDTAPVCTNLCAQVAQCSSASPTILEGTAFVPNGKDPLYNAVIYVPNGPLEPFPTGLSCDACGAPVTGSPLVSARSKVDGSFSLSNVPAGTNIPLVIQVGKWRRLITIPEIKPCVTNHVDEKLSRLPRDQSEGDLPQMAVVTGNADALECALVDYGVSVAEFTGPAYGGRVHVYIDNGSTIENAEDESNLMTVISQYDSVFYDCDGETPGGPSDRQQPLIDYTNGGGHLFTSHFGYGILENDPFASTMTLAQPTKDGAYGDAEGILSKGTSEAQTLTEWLSLVDAVSANGTVDIMLPKEDLVATMAPATTWMTTKAGSPVGATTQLYSFATPVGAEPSAQCGGVVYASYHVAGVFESAVGATFPGICLMNTFSPQERAYEFFVFDMPTCAP